MHDCIVLERMPPRCASTDGLHEASFVWIVAQSIGQLDARAGGIADA